MKIDAFLTESPVTAVVWAARTFEKKLTALFRERQLNLSAALVLVSILFEEPRKVTPSELAAVLSMTRGNLSHCVASLEAAGFITRKINPEDARVHHLTLKPQGRKAAMQVIRVLHRTQLSFEKTVGAAQIRGFLRVLKTIEEALGGAQDLH